MSEKTHDTGFAWFPASHWIRAHTRQSVRLDLIAGLSLAAFVIPEALAYGGLAPRTYRRLRRLREASRPEFRIAMLAFACSLPQPARL